MAKKKIYKAGTVITFWSSCNYAGTKTSQEITIEDDSTEDDLNEMAYEIALETVAPEGWFTVGGEDNDGNV
jgi:hypothetical protein